MDLATKLIELQKRTTDHRDILLTEEAAKTALVMPFIQALGYDVFNPREVIPEFTADVGTKKGEKVDYAICSGEKICILVECKPASSELTINNAGQLFRYFSVTEARLAILTNGVVYQFYTDSDQPNKMDQKPFFSFNLDSIRPGDVKTLEKFVKGGFDIAQIVAEASALKLKSTMRVELLREFSEPSEAFVKLVASMVHEGMITKKIREDIGKLLPITINDIIREIVTDRLSSALKASTPQSEPVVDTVPDFEATVTTEEEINGWRIIQAISAKLIDPKRVVTRDQKSYCGILIDDNNRKSLARLHFNGLTAKYVGTFLGKDETRHLISDLTDIYKLSDHIENRILELDKQK